MKTTQKIDCKKRAYRLSLAMIKFVDGLASDASTRVIVSQLLRSATSIGANMIEAQASPTKKDFTNYFNHSLKSANETKYWLMLLRDTGKANQTEVIELIRETEEISRMLGSSLLTLRGRRANGYN